MTYLTKATTALLLICYNQEVSITDALLSSTTDHHLRKDQDESRSLQQLYDCEAPTLDGPPFFVPLAYEEDEPIVKGHFIQYDDADTEKKIFVTEYLPPCNINFTSPTPWVGYSSVEHLGRAIIFLTGPEFHGNFWTIPQDGYNALKLAAANGYYAYTFDYVGFGQSFRPIDGYSVDISTQVQPINKLIDYIRTKHNDTNLKVDLVGEGYGAEVASQYKEDIDRVNTITMSVIVYKAFNQFIIDQFIDTVLPFVINATSSVPDDGYWSPNFLTLTLQGTRDEVVRDYVLATQGGRFPKGTLPLPEDLPIMEDIDEAKVPLLVISGGADVFPAPGDNAELANKWGQRLPQNNGPLGTLVVIPNATHVPRIEDISIVNQYYNELFNFLNNHIPI